MAKETDAEFVERIRGIVETCWLGKIDALDACTRLETANKLIESAAGQLDQSTEELEEKQEKIEQQQDVIKELVKTLKIENQCTKCRYGSRTSERCPGKADGELPCAGFKELFDGSVFLEQAIARAELKP